MTRPKFTIWRIPHFLSLRCLAGRRWLARPLSVFDCCLRVVHRGPVIDYGSPGIGRCDKYVEERDPQSDFSDASTLSILFCTITTSCSRHYASSIPSKNMWPRSYNTWHVAQRGGVTGALYTHFVMCASVNTRTRIGRGSSGRVCRL